MRKKLNYKHLIEDVCGLVYDVDIPQPSMTAQQALNELCDYFLGDDWYDPRGQVHPEIVNYDIVEEIERRYKGCKIKRGEKK